MIQQICLSKESGVSEVKFDQPIELVINAQDYVKFEKIISVLFDGESIERIKKAKDSLKS